MNQIEKRLKERGHSNPKKGIAAIQSFEVINIHDKDILIRELQGMRQDYIESGQMDPEGFGESITKPVVLKLDKLISEIHVITDKGAVKYKVKEVLDFAWKLSDMAGGMYGDFIDSWEDIFGYD